MYLRGSATKDATKDGYCVGQSIIDWYYGYSAYPLNGHLAPLLEPPLFLLASISRRNCHYHHGMADCGGGGGGGSGNGVTDMEKEKVKIITQIDDEDDDDGGGGGGDDDDDDEEEEEEEIRRCRDIERARKREGC